MSACYSALTPSEQDADYRNAERELNAIANASPEAAIAAHERKKAYLVPLLALRVSKGMTQKELSQKSGINVRQIRRIETGESDSHNVSAANLVALADALGVDIHELMYDEWITLMPAKPAKKSCKK